MIIVVLLINFPLLVTWFNSKPLYYDELFIDSNNLPTMKLTEDKKKYYKSTYKLLLTVFDSMLISLISNYWFFKTKTASSSYEIIGITGGILQIFHILNHFMGSVVLNVMRYFINNNHKIAISNDDIDENLNNLEMSDV